MLINSNDSNQFLFSKKNEDSIESYIVDEEKKSHSITDSFSYHSKFKINNSPLSANSPIPHSVLTIPHYYAPKFI